MYVLVQLPVLQPAAESGDDGPEPAQLEKQLLQHNLPKARVVHGVLVDIVLGCRLETQEMDSKLSSIAYELSMKKL